MSETKICLSTVIALLTVGPNDRATIFFFSAGRTPGRVIHPYGSLGAESRVVSKEPAAREGAAMVDRVDKSRGFELVERPRVVEK